MSEYQVGEKLYYKEFGSLVKVRVVQLNPIEDRSDSYRLKLEDVYIPGPGFEESNIGDEWDVTGSGTGNSPFFMFPLDEAPIPWLEQISFIEERRKVRQN